MTNYSEKCFFKNFNKLDKLLNNIKIKKNFKKLKNFKKIKNKTVSVVEVPKSPVSPQVENIEKEREELSVTTGLLKNGWMDGR